MFTSVPSKNLHLWTWTDPFNQSADTTWARDLRCTAPARLVVPPVTCFHWSSWRRSGERRTDWPATTHTATRVSPWRHLVTHFRNSLTRRFKAWLHRPTQGATSPSAGQPQEINTKKLMKWIFFMTLLKILTFINLIKIMMIIDH